MIICGDCFMPIHSGDEPDGLIFARLEVFEAATGRTRWDSVPIHTACFERERPGVTPVRTPWPKVADLLDA